LETLTAYLERLTVSRRMLGFAVLAMRRGACRRSLDLSPVAAVSPRSTAASTIIRTAALSTVKDMQYELLRMRHLLRDLMREENPAKREQLEREDLVDSDAQIFRRGAQLECVVCRRPAGH
jgi:hypothetical protein